MLLCCYVLHLCTEHRAQNTEYRIQNTEYKAAHKSNTNTPQVNHRLSEDTIKISSALCCSVSHPVLMAVSTASVTWQCPRSSTSRLRKEWHTCRHPVRAARGCTMSHYECTVCDCTACVLCVNVRCACTVC